jgi:hypothetical protein
MKLVRYALVISILAIAGACSVFRPLTFAPGTSEAEVVAQLGRPTNHYEDGKQHLLEYAKGPWGQQTYMARFDTDGKLLSYEQVLTVEKFNTIKIGASTKSDVLRTIGRPSETSYLPLRELEVWSYPHKESNVWDSMMHVHFDKAGVVQQMLNGPDPRFDPSDRGRGRGR